MDFADDLALLSWCAKNLQDKTDKLQSTASMVGLEINIGKTKVLAVNREDPEKRILIDG